MVRRKVDTTGGYQKPGSTKSWRGEIWAPKLVPMLNATKKGERESAAIARDAKAGKKRTRKNGAAVTFVGVRYRRRRRPSGPLRQYIARTLGRFKSSPLEDLNHHIGRFGQWPLDGLNHPPWGTHDLTVTRFKSSTPVHLNCHPHMA